MDDSSLRPFPSSRAYQKRCLQLRLQSGGKVAYIETNQLALPEHYENVPNFPEKFSVDGFIVCADVSTTFDDPGSPQRQFLETLLGALQGCKKPVVVALTKYDRAKQASVATIMEMISHFKKLQAPVVEVSAVKGINVDLCFLVLSHLIDSKKPRTRIISYSDTKSHLDERLRRLEEALQCVMDEFLREFDISVTDACHILKSIMEFTTLSELSGTERVQKLIRAKLSYLKQQLVKNKATHFEEVLPHLLVTVLPTLELDATPDSCRALIREGEKFNTYFVDIEDWREDTEFLKSSLDDQVPFKFLYDDVGTDLLEKHINEVRGHVVTFDTIL